MVMDAFGTRAPLVSVTIPDKVAPETWATAWNDPAVAITHTNRSRVSMKVTEYGDRFTLLDFMALLK